MASSRPSKPPAAITGLYLKKNRAKYQELRKEDMAPLARIFRDYPRVEPDHPDFQRYVKEIQTLCSKLPRRLRAGRIAMLSRALGGQNSHHPSHKCKPGQLCYIHAHLNRRLVYSIWDFVHENL